MIHIRQWKREKLAKRRGRTSIDVFRINDPVRLQNPKNRKWDIRGTIIEIRAHPNGKPSSYVVRKQNKKTTIRHSSHIRHDVTADGRSEPTKVSFQENPTAKEFSRVVMTRQRARELSERAQPVRGALKIRESSSEGESDTETSPQ